MKTKILLLLTGILYLNTYAQINFQDKAITRNADGALSVYAADIDGDGDMDVLSASFFDDKIAWYENRDGQGRFGPKQIITTNADGAESVFAVDIDGDGDMDVLSASVFDDKIAWYENTDGNGSFGPQQIITTSADGAGTVYAADIDGDGDMDVLSASFYDDKIAWYENTDGQGSFDEHIITTNAVGIFSVYAADIDGDGDMDVLSASQDDDKIAWYENTDGQGSFVEHIITTNADDAESVFAIDIDGDGDMDVLSGSFNDHKIAWYENLGGGDFGDINTNQNIISTNVEGAVTVYATDIDGDGDMDVFSASGWDNKIVWYENTDGQGSFGTQQIITTNAAGAFSVYATDIDGDGDMDVLSASRWDDKIAWYKNLGVSCPDADGDGVCDDDDICPGGDDNIDTDGDGIPDFCDTDCDDELISSFSTNPLTHQGSGSSGTTVNFPADNKDVSFNINGLGSKLNGNPSNRYIDEVTVSFVDGSGNAQSEGTYSGNIQSSVSIVISGEVQSLTLSLADIYDGDTGSNIISVDMSLISSCVTITAAPIIIMTQNEFGAEELRKFDLYPNPVSVRLDVQWESQTTEMDYLIISDIQGRIIEKHSIRNSNNIELNISRLRNGIYFIRMVDIKGKSYIKRVIKQ
jgi:FG-GAP-like repeat/Secretion system C-terminal sorting domain